MSLDDRSLDGAGISVPCGRAVVRLRPESLRTARPDQPLQQQQVALTQQNTELQNRIGTLDQDNQELETMLAQSQQQVRLFEDQVTAMRDQLRSTTSQLATVSQDRNAVDEKAKMLTASMRRARRSTDSGQQ